MKILITGDFHIQEGIYTNICMDYIEYIIKYCSENNIKDIIIDGDIFEKSSKIKNDAYIPLFFKFKQLKEEGYNIYIVLGNHDIYNVDNDSLVETFSVFGKVFKEVETLKFLDREITFLPYTKDIRDIPLEGDILVTHLPIADFCFDNKYHVNEKNGFPIETFKDWNIVFSGHFHRPQNKSNIIYPGSPYQMNFGEMGQKKGFIVYDLENNEWKREFYTQAPTYLKIKAENFNEIEVKNCFVQVDIENKVDNFIKLKHLLYDKGALNISPNYIEDENLINIKDGESGSIFSTNIKSLVEEYIINSVSMDGVDNNKLLKKFRELIE